MSLATLYPLTPEIEYIYVKSSLSKKSMNIIDSLYYIYALHEVTAKNALSASKLGHLLSQPTLHCLIHSIDQHTH